MPCEPLTAFEMRTMKAGGVEGAALNIYQYAGLLESHQALFKLTLEGGCDCKEIIIEISHFLLPQENRALKMEKKPYTLINALSKQKWFKMKENKKGKSSIF